LEAVDESIAPELVGFARWGALIEEHRPGIEGSVKHPEFADRVNAMFADAKVSHLHYYDDADWRYWLFGSRRAPGSDAAEVEHVGIFPQKIDGEWFVRGILEGSPAGSSDLRVGDRIVSVDGQEFHPILSFRGKSGRPVIIKVARTPQDEREVGIVPVQEWLFAAWLQATRNSIRVIEHGDLSFAYMHVWSTFGEDEYDRLADIQGDVNGLVLDFRDGYGGSTTQVFDFLVDQGPLRSQWQKPAVILTSSDGTRSAKELLAAEARAKHKVRLVGTKTAGAVLPCTWVPIGSDGLLVRPMHWSPLEGRPLEPDVLVERDIRYCGGDDPQLERGKEVLAEFIRSWRARPEKEPVASAEFRPTLSGTSLRDHGGEDPQEQHAERLQPLSAPVVGSVSFRTKWNDVDADGRPELFLPTWEGDVHLVSSDGASVETIRLQGVEPRNSISEILPLKIDGLQHWFAAYGTLEMGKRRQSTAALFTQSGERVWTLQPKLPGELDAEMALAVGDLDGDQIEEFVLGVSTYRSERTGQSTWTMRDYESYVFILDHFGEVLCKRKVPGALELIAVVESQDSHRTPILLVGLRDGLRRFRFSTNLTQAPSPAGMRDGSLEED
jgi:carboxyl-terminal processing protease